LSTGTVAHSIFPEILASPQQVSPGSTAFDLTEPNHEQGLQHSVSFDDSASTSILSKRLEASKNGFHIDQGGENDPNLTRRGSEESLTSHSQHLSRVKRYSRSNLSQQIHSIHTQEDSGENTGISVVPLTPIGDHPLPPLYSPIGSKSGLLDRKQPDLHSLNEVCSVQTRFPLKRFLNRLYYIAFTFSLLDQHLASGISGPTV